MKKVLYFIRMIFAGLGVFYCIDSFFLYVLIIEERVIGGFLGQFVLSVCLAFCSFFIDGIQSDDPKKES